MCFDNFSRTKHAAFVMFTSERIDGPQRVTYCRLVSCSKTADFTSFSGNFFFRSSIQNGDFGIVFSFAPVFVYVFEKAIIYVLISCYALVMRRSLNLRQRPFEVVIQRSVQVIRLHSC